MTKVEKKLTKVETLKKRVSYVLGYTMPTFTEYEWSLRNELKHYESWTPNTRYWSGNEADEWCFVPQPNEPKISNELKERIKNYDEYTKYFNSYYDNL